MSKPNQGGVMGLEHYSERMGPCEPETTQMSEQGQTLAPPTDTVDAIAVYDCSDGGHSDKAGASAFDLMISARSEIIALRASQAALEKLCKQQGQEIAITRERDEALEHSQAALVEERDEWKQAAQVEARLRREFLARAEAAESREAALVEALKPLMVLSPGWCGALVAAMGARRSNQMSDCGREQADADLELAKALADGLPRIQRALAAQSLTAQKQEQPCQHEWKPRGDFDLGGDRTEVICTKCQVAGERNDKTGEVFWPAT